MTQPISLGFLAYMQGNTQNQPSTAGLSTPIEQRKGGASVAKNAAILQQRRDAGYDILRDDQGSEQFWGGRSDPSQRYPDSAYQKALTDTDTRPAQAPIYVAEYKVPEAPQMPIFETIHASQATLRDWLGILGGAMLYAADSAKQGIQQVAKAGATQLKPVAGQIGNELSLSAFWKNRGPESFAPKGLVTDKNVAEFALTGSTTNPRQEELQAKLSYVRGKLGEISQRMRAAQVAREESDVENQQILRELVSTPDAANKFAGAKRFRTPRTLTEQEAAQVRMDLKTIRQTKSAQKELVVPKGRQTGHKFNSRDDRQETRVGGAGANIGG